MSILAVTDASFEQEVMRAELPVVIDFSSQRTTPNTELEAVDAELGDKVKLVRIMAEAAPRVAQYLSVDQLPSLFVVHRGRVVAGQGGYVPKEAIIEALTPLLPSDASEIDTKALAALLQQRRALPVDIRDESSFGRTHIPGAIHIAEDELQTRAKELAPSDGRVRVLYGRSTAEAKTAAESLIEQGVQVGFLDGGFLHWEADGFEVERPE